MIGFGDPGHFQCAHDRSLRAQMFQRIPHIQAVLQGAQHPHLVGGHGAHAHGGAPAAAPHVATADDHGQLHAGFLHVDEHPRGLFKFFMAEAVSVHAQRFAAQFQNDPMISRHFVSPFFAYPVPKKRAAAGRTEGAGPKPLKFLVFVQRPFRGRCPLKTPAQGL